MRYLMIALAAAVLLMPLFGCHDKTTTEHNGLTGSTTHTHDVDGN